MISVGSYWKRRRVEPCPEATSQTLLYLRIAIGTYVLVKGVGPPKDTIDYGLIGPERQADWDTTYTKIFKIYFEEVTDEAELGLIALAEQGEQ